MGLPWVRLDTSLPDNPKILDLLCEDEGKSAAFVYICAMAYAGKHGTDGFIPKSALGHINGTREEALMLVKASLWIDAPGGWQIHAWDEYQISDDDAKARKARAQAAAVARWSK